MEIQEAVKRQQELSREINRLILKFEEETPLSVRKVDFDRIDLATHDDPHKSRPILSLQTKVAITSN